MRAIHFSPDGFRIDKPTPFLQNYLQNYFFHIKREKNRFSSQFHWKKSLNTLVSSRQHRNSKKSYKQGPKVRFKMRVSNVSLVCSFLLVVVLVVVQAQVNFSPAWGKRGSLGPHSPQIRDGGEGVPLTPGECKLPFEGVVRILKLIQVEAQRLLRCEGIPPEAE